MAEEINKFYRDHTLNLASNPLKIIELNSWIRSGFLSGIIKLKMSKA